MGEDGYGAAFRTDEGASAVVLWRETGHTTVQMTLGDLPEGCVPHDLMGVPIHRGDHELGWGPIYVVSETLPPGHLAREVERALGG
jgi:hypothetical protein